MTHRNTIRADDLPVVRDELESIRPSPDSRDWGCPVTPAATIGKGMTDSHRRHQSCLAGPAATQTLARAPVLPWLRPTGLSFIYGGIIGLRCFGEQEPSGGLFCLLRPWE